MATRYQHVLDSIRKEVAKQAGGLLWKGPDLEEPGSDEADDLPRGLVRQRGGTN